MHRSDSPRHIRGSNGIQTFPTGGYCVAHGAPIYAAPADYHFNVLYLGDNSSIPRVVSDDPSGVMLVPGDSFRWTITTQGSRSWHVDQSDEYFFLMAFAVLQNGDRTGDVSLSLRSGGTEVFSFSEVGAINSTGHVGTEPIELSAGLSFTQMQVDYTLIDSVENGGTDPVGTTLATRRLPIFGTPELRTGINFVPEPGSLAILFLGGAICLWRRRAAVGGTSEARFG